MPDQVDWRAVEREATPGRAVGRLLRDQREARGLSLSEVEKSLRIRRSHLEAIEDGRFDYRMDDGSLLCVAATCVVHCRWVLPHQKATTRRLFWKLQQTAKLIASFFLAQTH